MHPQQPTNDYCSNVTPTLPPIMNPDAAFFNNVGGEGTPPERKPSVKVLTNNFEQKEAQKAPIPPDEGGNNSFYYKVERWKVLQP